MTRASLPASPPSSPSRLEAFEDSSDLLDDPERLLERAGRDGYLFFRGLLDPEPILDLRRQLLTVLDRYGLRAADAGPLSGKLDVNKVNGIPIQDLRIDIGVTEQMYFDMTRLPAHFRLTRHPTLLNLYRTLFGEEVLVHPRRAIRAFTPHRQQTPTPPHQDFPLVQGNTNFWTCWFPIGDCPLDRGPLAILRGSHRDGVLPLRLGDNTTIDWSDWGTQLCADETDWVGGDFAAGDVLTFPCFTVHQACPMRAADEIRLSLDVRYQRASDPVCDRSLLCHALSPTTNDIASWDEIYADWTDEDTDLMYYWDKARLSLTSFDDAFLEPGQRRIC